MREDEVGYSILGQCEKSPDTRHEYHHAGWGYEMNEYWKCIYCDYTFVD